MRIMRNFIGNFTNNISNGRQKAFLVRCIRIDI